jgi:heme exporter protein A
MRNFLLKATDLAKAFSHGKNIFAKIGMEVTNGDVIAVTGHNGSGKTTLLKILAGVVKPTKGAINLEIGGKTIDSELYFEHIGYVAPYLNLYEEFTPMEHLKIFYMIRGRKFDNEKAETYLKYFNLFRKRDDPIRTYSSGMKQRFKYVLALQNDFELLFLDEPMTNLDSEGCDAVMKIIEEHKNKNCGIVIATNEERDKSVCSKIISLGNQDKK